MPTPMKFVGGLPCLDFVNTVGSWVSGRVVDDKIESYSDLIRWAELAGLAIVGSPRPDRRRASKVLARSRALRGALHRLLTSLLDHRNPSSADLAIIGAELRLARTHEVLTTQRGKFLWTFDHPHALDSVLWQVSQSAADLLTSTDLARVRRCAGENCGWMFLDTTRNHSRHWCDMQDCGNRAKVRRFRARQAQAHPPR